MRISQCAEELQAAGKNHLSPSKKVMFQRVSGYYLKAFELHISKYQLMKEDFSIKACANIIILLSDF